MPGGTAPPVGGRQRAAGAPWFKRALAGAGPPGNTGNPVRRGLRAPGMASLTVAECLIWLASAARAGAPAMTAGPAISMVGQIARTMGGGHGRPTSSRPDGRAAPGLVGHRPAGYSRARGEAVSPAAKLCGFLLLLGIIFGSAYAAGAHLGPIAVRSPVPANGQPMRMGAPAPAGQPSPLAGTAEGESRP